MRRVFGIMLRDRVWGETSAAWPSGLGFGYVVRFRGIISVTDAGGTTKAAADWVRRRGEARTLRDAAVTAERHPVATVVCVRDQDMGDACSLAASDPTASAATLMGYYARHWEGDTSFRDSKKPAIWDGAGAGAGEGDGAAGPAVAVGYAGDGAVYPPRDGRILKANTVKGRTHSLFRQGLHALRVAADDAGGASASVGRALRRDVARATNLHRGTVHQSTALEVPQGGPAESCNRTL